jgi:hypothetical protein
MKRKATQQGLLTVMQVLSTCEMPEDLRERCFALVGGLTTDKMVLDKRAKQIIINRRKENGTDNLRSE